MEPKHANDDEVVNDPNYNPEEEVHEGNWKIVNLPEVKLETGEESSEEIATFYCKLYRFKDGEWKERAVGNIRFLRNKETKKTFVLLRSETKRAMCYFFVVGEGICKLEKMTSAEKSWMWTCLDFSEGKNLSNFAARFKTPEDYDSFAKHFNEAYEENSKLDWNTKTDCKKEEEKKEETKEEEKKEEKKEEKATQESEASAPEEKKD